MKKILALDLGDVWTGIAISDPLGIIARPYTTFATNELHKGLKDIFAKEVIGTVVVGYPKTMKGQESEQTRKIVQKKESLEQLFPDVQWVLADERLSSKRATNLRKEQGKKTTGKQDKLQEHALAAAFVLDNYLFYLSTLHPIDDEYTDNE